MRRNRASILTKPSSQLENPPERIHPNFCACRVVKFRRTGESSRSDEDGISGEHEVQIEGVRTELEPVELGDGAAVPKEFANPTDGEQGSRFPARLWRKVGSLHLGQAGGLEKLGSPG